MWKAKQPRTDHKALKAWWAEIDGWRSRNCLAYKQDKETIKPQYALERLYHHIKNRDHYITTEVGQHQMWAAQFLKFEQPNRWMTSGGLGTMGYGFPAAVGVQIAHPEALVIDVAGEASILMNIQELSTVAQYRLPVKIFILNNQYMGMVRQWQELLHGSRYSESYMESLPDFVKLAEAFGARGLRCHEPDKLDDTIQEMIRLWKAREAKGQPKVDQKALKAWWAEIETWRARNCLAYKADKKTIKPQYALERLYHHIKDKDHYITTEVGQHQMWAAQFLKFEQPNRWMTSGGLGTMGYGLPAAVGVQMAHPDALVIDIAGDASVQMTMQEMSTAIQYGLPIKIFILNNEWMGMVRQWQQLLHGERYSHSYSDSLPDFVKLAEAFGGVG